MRVAPMSSRFLEACRRRPTDVRPVWFMRQAGRYLKQYRDIRAKHGILDICKQPELAAAVTLQPVEILDVDAAIIFADLLLPVEPMGLKLKFVSGEGPVIGNPVRTSEDVDALSISNTDDLGYVGDAIRQVVGALAGKVPVIGFVGAPFTLASYMIEGGASKTFLRTKQMMYSNETLWRRLMGKIVDVLGRAPDVHSLPVGNAGNITAYWKGYREYHADGVIDALPRYPLAEIRFVLFSARDYEIYRRLLAADNALTKIQPDGKAE